MGNRPFDSRLWHCEPVPVPWTLKGLEEVLQKRRPFKRDATCPVVIGAKGPSASASTESDASPERKLRGPERQKVMPTVNVVNS